MMNAYVPFTSYLTYDRSKSVFISKNPSGVEILKDKKNGFYSTIPLISEIDIPLPHEAR